MKFSRFLFVVLLIVSLSTLGCRHFMYGDYSDSAVTGSNTISGTVTVGSAGGSIRHQMIAGNAIPGARVWVEDRPDLFAVTDENGEYVIDNVPAGKFKIISRFRDGDDWFFDFDEAEIAEDTFETQNVDLSALRGTNVVTGILRDEDGNPLRNVSLSLWGDDWGDDFKTDENGRFTSPALPSDWDIEDLTQDIIINRGQSSEFRFPVTFVSDDAPLDVEIVVTDDPARSAVYPRATMYAYDPDNTERTKLIEEVEPGQQIKVRARIFPRNARNVEWSASRGDLSDKIDVDFDDDRFSVVEQTWTAPSQLGVATITVEVTNDGKTARARLPILVDTQAPLRTITFNMNAGDANTKGNAPSQQQIREGASDKLSDADNFYKYGYGFYAWNTQEDLEGDSYSAGEDFTMPEKNITLYAQWVKFAGGQGTEADPYLIARADHLHEIREHLDKYFLQTENIDLSGNLNDGWSEEWYNDTDGWEPIDDFEGTYNGDEKIISGLTIEEPIVPTIAPTSYWGLFGSANGAVFKNIRLKDVDIEADGRTGALAGGITDSEVINCSATGKITGEDVDELGGLIGDVQSSTISNSHAEVKVTGRNRIGGLIGRMTGGEIINCSATGDVEGNTNVGGLAGMIQADVPFSVSTDRLKDSHATGNVSGNSNVGGLVGAAYQFEIENCYATGVVEGETQNVGGLIGYNQSEILNCYATGNVYQSVEQLGYHFGGLVGYLWAEDIDNSYSTGNVIASDALYVGGFIGYNGEGGIRNCYAHGDVVGSNFVGGFVGQNGSGMGDELIWNSYSKGEVEGAGSVGGFAGTNHSDILGCYYDQQTSDQSDAGKGEPRSTAEMQGGKTDTTFVGWSTDIWDFPTGEYPEIKPNAPKEVLD